MPNDPLSPHALTDPTRLAALDALGILDTPPEEGFEAIVRLATRLCAAPVALVSLVSHDRQWFKARVNFPPCETDLDRSVCKFALAEPDLLVIDDLAEDPRTAGNPLVTGEPRIRFYAGAPLRTAEGQAVGSLCVIDTVPRPGGLAPEQAEDLRALAGQVVAQLQMRRAVADRDRLLAHQRTALRQAGRLDVLAKASSALLAADDPAAVLEPILADGAEVLGFDRAYIYDVAPDGRHLRLTHAVNATRQVRDYLARMPYGSPLCGIVAETGRPLILDGIQVGTEPEYAASRGFGLDAYAGFPVVSRGELCGVISFASTQVPAFDEEALAFFETLARLMAAVHDRLEGEAALAEVGAYWRSLFERLTEGFVVGEVVRDPEGRVVDWRYVEVNRAFGELVGLESRGVVGRTLREVLPGIEDAWVDEFARVVETREPVTFLRRVGVLDRWYEGRAFAIASERFGVIFLEVTDRVHAEARRTAQLAIGDRLRDLTAIPEMTHAVSEIVGRTLGATRAGFGRVDAGIEFIEIEPDWTAPGVASIAGRHRFADYGDLRGELLRGEALVIEDVRTDPRTRADPGPLLAIGVGALVNVPVRDRGRTVAIFIVQDRGPRAWSVETLSFLRNVAERLEAGVARVRAEEEQRLLNGEVSHRLKNTLAMVQAIAKQTLRGVAEREPVEAFERRVMALARAQDLLLEGQWSGASMRAVVDGVLSLHAPTERLAAAGTDLQLNPQAAMSLSLLLHELATNAVKYGALSGEAGRVAVAWRIEDGPEPILLLDWRERGGPPARAPTRRGFGSRLIQNGLIGTRDATLSYDDLGLEAEFRAPLAQVRAA